MKRNIDYLNVQLESIVFFEQRKRIEFWKSFNA